MTTFYDLIKELAYNIGDTREGTATGGTTTTLIDTTLGEANDYYNKGTLLIEQATPVIVKVTDYASATTTFTFGAIDTAVAAGIAYTAIHMRWPLDVLRRAINLALLEHGKVMDIDESLTIVADQERYTKPGTVTDDIRRIELGDEDEDNWEIHYGWRVEDGEIRFLGWNPTDTTKTARIHYVKQHAALDALTDTLDEQVNREALMVSACKHALKWRNAKVGKDEPGITELLNYYLSLDAQYRNKRTSELLNRDPILARY